MGSLEATHAAPPALGTYHVPALTSSSTPPVDELFATLVEGAFDLIEELGESDLSLYLHVPHNDQPVLYSRRPELAAMAPSANFRLMHTVTMLSNGKKPFAAFRHGELQGHYVRTGGPLSDGIFVFGPIQQPHVAERMHAVTRAFARVLHQFHLDERTTSETAPLVDIDEYGGSVRSNVTVTRKDGGRLVGSATGQKAEETVARATIEAIGSGHIFDEFQSISLGSRTGVLSLLRDSNDDLQLGLAFSNGDLLQTVALATARAIFETDAFATTGI